MTYKGKYRTQTFGRNRYSGAYAQVFQRPNEKALVEVDFFDGDRDEKQTAYNLMILQEAHALQKKWNSEK